MHTQWHDHPERTIRHVLLISNSTFRTTLLRDRADAHVHRRHALRVVLISIFFLHLCTNLLLLGQQRDLYRFFVYDRRFDELHRSLLLLTGYTDMCISRPGLQCGLRHHWAPASQATNRTQEWHCYSSMECIECLRMHRIGHQWSELDRDLGLPCNVGDHATNYVHARMYRACGTVIHFRDPVGESRTSVSGAVVAVRSRIFADV